MHTAYKFRQAYQIELVVQHIKAQIITIPCHGFTISDESIDTFKLSTSCDSNVHLRITWLDNTTRIYSSLVKAYINHAHTIPNIVHWKTYRNAEKFRLTKKLPYFK